MPERDAPDSAPGVPGAAPGARWRGPWRVVGSREVYANPWIRVREDQVLRPNGAPGIYGVIEFAPAVGVVALTPDQQVYLVGQHRYPTDSYSWEIVTGYAEPVEGLPAAEGLLHSARRELREEAGLTAARWTPLGACHISNSVTDQVGHLYLARELTEGAPEPDETEQIAVRRVPLAGAVAMAQAGEIVQAFSLVGLYRAWHLLHPGAGPGEPAARADAPG